MRISEADRVKVALALGGAFKVSSIDPSDVYGGFSVEWAAGGTTPIHVWSEGSRRVLSRIRVSRSSGGDKTTIPTGRGWHEACADLLRRALTPVVERPKTESRDP